MVYKHNDMASLEEKLSKCGDSRDMLIVTDGVFSMKGTVADLPGIKKLADRFGASDHGGRRARHGCDGRDRAEDARALRHGGAVDLVCGTFSKSLGTIGGFTRPRRRSCHVPQTELSSVHLLGESSSGVDGHGARLSGGHREEPELLDSASGRTPTS